MPSNNCSTCGVSCLALCMIGLGACQCGHPPAVSRILPPRMFPINSPFNNSSSLSWYPCIYQWTTCFTKNSRHLMVPFRFSCYMFFINIQRTFTGITKPCGTSAYWKIDGTKSRMISLTLLLFVFLISNWRSPYILFFSKVYSTVCFFEVWKRNSGVKLRTANSAFESRSLESW